MNRRSFIRGLFAAPAIVAIGNIMPVRVIERLITPLVPEPLAFGPMLDLGDLVKLNDETFRVTGISMSGLGRVEYDFAGIRPGLRASLVMNERMTASGDLSFFRVSGNPKQKDPQAH